MPAKTAVLLTNLGTPERLERAAVQRFLQEFLSDPYVVNLPRLLWQPLLRGLILPIRSGKTLSAYQRVWRGDGSPLLVFSQRQTDALQAALGEQVRVGLAMRYGQPAFAETLASLLDGGIERLVVLPLYPQYSRTTTETSRVHLRQTLNAFGESPEIEFIDSYHDHPDYIAALAESVREQWRTRQNHLLMSFHGLPKIYVERGDPYQDQCETTARLLADALGLADSDWSLGYQSRFGRQTWLQPYTADLLHEMGASSPDAVDVICPGFAADCLETLDEIEIEYRRHYIDCGGREFRYISALNDGRLHIEMMRSLVQPRLADEVRPESN